MEEKICKWCFETLVQKENESPCQFKVRITCGKVCAGKLKKGIAKDKVNRAFIGGYHGKSR
jgi:hypothetical protein